MQSINDIDYSETSSSQRLFKRVILLSGNALSNWAFASDPVTKAEYLIKQLCLNLTDIPGENGSDQDKLGHG